MRDLGADLMTKCRCRIASLRSGSSNPQGGHGVQLIDIVQAWIGLTIYGTKRPSIDNLQSRPTILSSRTSCFELASVEVAKNVEDRQTGGQACCDGKGFRRLPSLSVPRSRAARAYQKHFQDRPSSGERLVSPRQKTGVRRTLPCQQRT